MGRACSDGGPELHAGGPVAATPSSLHFTQMRIPHTYNPNGIAAEKWLTERVIL